MQSVLPGATPSDTAAMAHRIAASYRAEGRDADTYKLATTVPIGSMPQLQWDAGFAAYRLGDWKNAEAYLEGLAENHEAQPSLRAQAALWAARAHMQSGNLLKVVTLLNFAASKQPSFYGLIAERMLGIDTQTGFADAILNEADFRDLMAAPAARRAVGIDGFEKILRAGRQVAATRTRAAQPDEEGRNRPLVKPDAATDGDFHTFKYPAREASARHSPARAANVARTAEPRRTTTIQIPAGRDGRCARKISRKRRRARLRSWAGPVRRAAITPKRAAAEEGLCQVPRTMSLPCCAVPCCLTVANSSRQVRRAALGSLSAGIKPPGLKQQPVKPRCGGRSESRRPWGADACGPAGDDGPEWRDRLRPKEVGFDFIARMKER